MDLLSTDPNNALAGLGLTPAQLAAIPAFNLAPAAPQRGLVGAALSSGIDDLQGLGGSALQAAGKLSGLGMLEQLGAGIAERNQAESQANGRPDLETAPWRDGGSPVAPWLAYQTIKQLPQIAGMVAAGALVPEAAVPAALSRLGAAVPGIMGGGRGLAAEAATAAGERWAAGMVGGTAAGYVPAVGSMYQEASNREKAGGGETTKSDALKAALMGVPYAAMDALEARQLAGFVEKGLTGNVFARATRGMAAGALQEMPQEAAQTAMEMSFRPDLTMKQKADQIIDAAITGAAVGGVLGGAAGSLRRTKVADPSTLDNNALAEQVDNATMLALPAPLKQIGPPDPAIEIGTTKQITASRPVVEEPGGQVRSALVGPNDPVGQAAPETNPLQGADTPFLTRAVDLLQSKMETGKFNQDDVKTLRQAQAELQRRGPQEDALAANPRTQLSPEATPQVRSVAERLAAADRGITPAVENLHQELLGDLGRDKSAAISKIRAESKPELVAALQDQVNEGKALPRDLTSLAQKYGVLTSDGQVRDLPAEIEAARAKMDEFQAKAKQSGKAQDLRRAQHFQALRDDLMQKQELLNDATRFRGEQAMLIAPTGRTQADNDAIAAAQALGAKTEETRAPAAPALLSVSAAPATRNDFTEEEKGNRDRLASRMADIAVDKGLSEQLRETAKQVKTQFTQGAVNAEDNANQVLAKLHNETGRTVFSASPDTSVSPAMPREAFDAAFARATTRLSPESRGQIKVVDNVSQLPEGVVEAAAQKGLDPARVRGVLHNGDVYVVKSNIRSEGDLQETIMHEVLGHGGARALFGNSREGVMQDLFHASGGLSGIQSIARKYGVQKELSQYIPKGEITDAHRAEIFDELLAQVAGKATGKFKTALMEWAGRIKQALIGLLNKAGFTSAANQLKGIDALDVAVLVADMRQAALKGGVAAEPGTAFQADPKTVAGANDLVGKLNAAGTQILNALSKPETLKLKTRDAVLYASSVHHMAEHYGEMMPHLKDFEDVQFKRAAITARLSQLFSNAYNDFARLEKTNPKLAESIVKLMRYTEHSVDPRKVPAQHSWLMDKPNWANLEKIAARANIEYTEVKRAGAHTVYDKLLAVNEAINYASMSVAMHNLIASDPVASNTIKSVNPMDKYIQTESVYNSPIGARDYWKATLEQQIKDARAYLQNVPKASNKAVKDGLVKPLASRVVSAEQSIAKMQEAPYFHLGRAGDYMVAFAARQMPNSKSADPAAMDAIAQRLQDEGYNGAEISGDNENPKVFLRLETPEQYVAVTKIVEDMMKKGLLNPSEPIVRGNRKTDAHLTRFETNPEWLDSFLTALRGRYEGDVLDTLPKADRDATERVLNDVLKTARDQWLDQLPETALARVLVKRNSVSGYSKDMIQNFAHRMVVGTNALAGLSVATDTSNAFAGMHADVNAAKKGAKSASDTLAMQSLMSEMMIRESQRRTMVKSDWIDKWRALNHAYFLGMSPSYVAVNMTQLGVTLWPELSKKHGFVGAAKAMARVTPMAFKIMKATFNEGRKLGTHGGADAMISPEALDAAGIKGADRDFVMRLVSTGAIDIGSASRELGRIAESRDNSALDNTLRWSAAAGYYSETLTRLIAGMAARELNGKKNDDTEMKYAVKTINESMFNYAQANTSRMTGRMGLAGQLSPVMFSFMTYTHQLTEKLYRELHTAFLDKAKTPKEKSEARTFLGVHLAAMTVLAGSLGMPAASVFASVADKLGGLFGDDDDPWDVKSAWRRMLSDTFGKDVGEVLARGLPRAIGLDISQRVGEQDIIPFSRLLSDKRKITDATKDWAAQALGSPVGMLFNIAEGLESMSNGNLLEGMQKMVPTAIRGPMAAYQMTDKGYTDARGNVLPMTPGANDILAQALGFKPAEKAQYDEKNMAQIVRKGELTRVASNIRKNLANAIEQEDVAGQKQWLAEAKRFDKNQPAYAILPSIGSTIERRARERAIAARTGNPIGTNMKDEGARALTQY